MQLRINLFSLNMPERKFWSTLFDDKFTYTNLQNLFNSKETEHFLCINEYILKMKEWYLFFLLSIKSWYSPQAYPTEKSRIFLEIC